MLHYWSLKDLDLQSAWLTIGSFDGVHLGHQAILRGLTEGAHAEGLPAAVITFYPHPAVVLNTRKDFAYLSSPEEKASLMDELGVDVVVTHPFNPQVARLSAREFIQSLSQRLNFLCMVAGQDFGLGRSREGNLQTLTDLGREFGFRVNVIQPVELEGQPLSSSRVRKALAAGEVDAAARLLGHPYQLSGEVVHGDSRGRSLGFPTANLEIWSARCLPKPGVYACRAYFQGQVFAAVANVGFRPTFDNQPSSPRVEAHLLDYSGDLYRRTLSLAFIQRLRDETRFENSQSLILQVQKDIRAGRRLLLTKRQ